MDRAVKIPLINEVIQLSECNVQCIVAIDQDELCKGCYFIDCDTRCFKYECASELRPIDNTDVIFVKN